MTSKDELLTEFKSLFGQIPMPGLDIETVKALDPGYPEYLKNIHAIEWQNVSRPFIRRNSEFFMVLTDESYAYYFQSVLSAALDDIEDGDNPFIEAIIYELDGDRWNRLLNISQIKFLRNMLINCEGSYLEDDRKLAINNINAHLKSDA